MYTELVLMHLELFRATHTLAHCHCHRGLRGPSALCETAFCPHSLQCQLYHGSAWLVLSSPCFGVRRQNSGYGRPGPKSHSFDLNTSWLRSQLSGPDGTHCQVLTRDAHCVPWGRSLRCVLRSCWEPVLQAPFSAGTSGGVTPRGRWVVCVSLP